jgi:hypothetical protein
VLAYLNGQYLPRSAATIPVEDRGFIFGDGVYEVWRAVNGRLFETDRHLARLAFGLRELRIAAPDIARRDVLDEVADRLLTESGLLDGEATLYLEITRGVAPRTHQFPPAGTAPTVFATANRFVPPNDLRSRGASAITVPDVRWLRCDIKTIQLLPNVMAKQAAAERVKPAQAFWLEVGRVRKASGRVPGYRLAVEGARPYVEAAPRQHVEREARAGPHLERPQPLAAAFVIRDRADARKLVHMPGELPKLFRGPLAAEESWHKRSPG